MIIKIYIRFVPKYYFQINFLLLMMVRQACFGQLTSSNQIDLTCKGISGGTDIRSEYREFDITVDTVTGEMFNYPERVSMGCIVSPKKGSITCSAQRNHISCECKADPLLLNEVQCIYQEIQAN